MGVGLYRTHPPFRDAIDEVFALWGKEGREIRADWLGTADQIDIDRTQRSQPLLFALDYALGTVVLDWGITPRALLGHSVGEVAAATLSGVLTLSEAARVVSDRVRHLAAGPAGGMLVVAGSPAEVEPHLSTGVHIGAVNAARQVMLAGGETALERTRVRLQAAGLVSRRVRAHSPFHSPLLAEAAAKGLAALSTVDFKPPRIPLYSGYTGDLLPASRAQEPAFWAEQPTQPVYFADALAAVSTLGEAVFVEVGPGQSLTSLVSRTRAVTTGGSTALSTLPRLAREPAADLSHLRRTYARLHELNIVAGEQEREPCQEES